MVLWLLLLLSSGAEILRPEGQTVLDKVFELASYSQKILRQIMIRKIVDDEIDAIQRLIEMGQQNQNTKTSITKNPTLKTKSSIFCINSWMRKEIGTKFCELKVLTRHLQHDTRIDSLRVVYRRVENYDMPYRVGRIVNSSLEIKRLWYVNVI